MRVKIPRTATRRGAVAYAKLLERVTADARDGFGFEGRFLRPGGSVEIAELGERPVLIEATDGDLTYGDRRQGRYTRLYILWRFDHHSNEWFEIARTQALACEWVEVLREPARIALGKTSWAIVPKTAEAIDRIRSLLEQELERLDPAQRGQVVAELHDQFAARIAAAGVGLVVHTRPQLPEQEPPKDAETGDRSRQIQRIKPESEISRAGRREENHV